MAKVGEIWARSGIGSAAHMFKCEVGLPRATKMAGGWNRLAGPFER